MFEIFALLLCTLAIAMVLWPLSLKQKAGSARLDADYFKEQLNDIEQRIAASTGSNPTLEEERVEVARRLLRASRLDESANETQPLGRGFKTLLSLIAIIGIPLVAAILYFQQGAFGVEDAPLASVSTKQLKDLPVENLIVRAEAQLEKNPDDLRGWTVLEKVYARLGRSTEQKEALQQIIRLDGETSDRLAALAELQILQDGNVVTEQAKNLLIRARQLDAENPRAAFFLALAYEQEGEFETALSLLNGLLAKAESGSPLEPILKQRIAELETRTNTSVPTPDAGAISAAEEMSAPDRLQFIQSMVERLADKVTQSPDEKTNWPRLINAYIVLEQYDNAQRVIERARKRFQNDKSLMTTIDQLATRMEAEKAKKQ